MSKGGSTKTKSTKGKCPQANRPKVRISSPWSRWKKPGKKKIRTGGIIAAMLILSGSACYTVFLAPLGEQEKWIYKEAAVERGILKLGVSESGSLDYGITSIRYNLNLDADSDDDEEDREDTSQDTGQEDSQENQKYLKVEEIYIAQGDRIQQGDKVMKFTDNSVSDVRKLLEKAFIDAKIDVNEAESEYNLSALEAKTEYDSSLVSAGYANNIYKAENSAVNDDINVMKVEVEQRTANISVLEEKTAAAQDSYHAAQEAYEKARQSLESTGTENLYNYLSVKNSYLNAQTKYQSAKSALDQAKENQEENKAQIENLNDQISLALKRSDIDMLDVNYNYQESVMNGENARITYQAKLESLKEEMQNAQEKLQKVEEQLEAFQNFVGSDGIVYADGDGIVTEVGYREEDILTSSGTVFSYASQEDMTISVDVTQEDVVVLNVGDQVDILFSAYEDVYEGTILSIETTAVSQESATVSYKVTIGVEGDTSRLYGGMTADITFITDKKEDVLYISKKAIVEENGKQYVYVKNASGGRELKQVETGISNGTSVEILSGLTQEDTIYMASRVSSQAEVEDTGKEENTGALEAQTEMPDMGGMMQQGNVMEIFEGMEPEWSERNQKMEAVP